MFVYKYRILFLSFLFLISCDQQESPNIPAYFFDEQIKVKDIADSTSLEILKVALKKEKGESIEGKYAYINYDSTEFVRVYFSQIYDTITPKDTIILFLKNNKDIYITDIRQIYAPKRAPIFVQYRIDNKLFRKGAIIEQ